MNRNTIAAAHAPQTPSLITGKLVAIVMAASLTAGFAAGAIGTAITGSATASAGGSQSAMGTPPNGTGGMGGANTMTYDYTGSYSTTVEAGTDTEIADETIGRTAYDDQFGTSTSWTMA